MSKIDPRWWLTEEPEKNAHTIVIPLVRALDDDLATTRDRMLQNAQLYDPATEMVGAGDDFKTGPWPFGWDEDGPCTLNVVRSVVDTVTSMIAKNRPRAAFVTDNAQFTTSQRAKQLERFIEGEFRRTDVYADAVRVFRDACIMGLGALKIYEDGGRVNVERVSPDNFVVDRAECRVGPPRQLHELRYFDRSQLMEMYPDHAEAIEKAPGPQAAGPRAWASSTVEQQVVPVIESWHLSSTPDADDGAHCITIDGATLLWEPYKRDYFPFAFYRWSEGLAGFFGAGLVEELTGIQNRINNINSYIGRCHRYANSFIIVSADDAGLSLKMSKGAPFKVLAIRGAMEPKFASPQLVQSELYSHLSYLVEMAYKIAGVSELSAHSQLPAGMDKASGIAIQTFSDLETQRFSIQSQHFEAMFLEVARQYVTIQKEIAAGGGDPETTWNQRSLMRRIKWSEVDLEEDLYTISIEAASMLSRTPAGRIQAAIELGNAALLERDELRRLIGHPDLERTLSLKDAAMDHAEAIIEKLNRSEYVPPEPLDNLNIVVPMVANAFLVARDGGADEDVLDTYRVWMKAAMDVMAPPTPQTGPEAMAMQGPPQPGGMPGAPGGMPGGMPVPGTLQQQPAIPTPPPVGVPPTGFP